jgi:hypothetical protein
MRRWKQPVSLGCDVYDPDNSRHHQGMDHDVAETDRRTDKKLAKYCFLLCVDANLNFTSNCWSFGGRRVRSTLQKLAGAPVGQADDLCQSISCR